MPAGDDGGGARNSPGLAVLATMHKLTSQFARAFRKLDPLEREDVARQMLGFLGAHIADLERGWGSLMWVDGEGAMSRASACTLVELLNDVGPARKRRMS